MLDLFAAPVRKEPRPHQSAALTDLRLSLARGARRPCLRLATGAGKTFIASLIVRGALAKGNRVVFTVPAISLIDQTVEAFEAEGITGIGVIQADHPRTDPHAKVQVASVQTLARRDWPLASVVIVDEAHRKSEAILKWMAAKPEVIFIGLTATPGRAGMGLEYDVLVEGATTRELIDLGILSPYRVYAPSHPDLSGVRTLAGDYREDDLAKVMGDAKLVADVVSTWGAKAEGRPTLVFAVDRAHAKHLQSSFEDAGVPCGYIDAYTPDVERRLIAARFASGALPVVCNVGCLTTGIDWDVRCIVLARPTKSEMLYVQMIGRGLRVAEGKDDCLILDHSDTTLRLGFVDEISFDSLPKTKADAAPKERKEPLPKECGSCGFVKPPKTQVCPACGHKAEPRTGPDAADGELVELKGGKAKKAPSRADRQVFWSMALWVDGKRGKAGKLATALYKSKFGEWPPRWLIRVDARPDPAFLAYEHSRRIAYAKSWGRNQGEQNRAA